MHRTTHAAPEKVVSLEGITEYRLDNGLRILLFPDKSRPTVTVNLTVFVGSRHEGYGETGMAHLLEHMLFKGTPTHENIPKLLQDRGADFNGSTWVDRTNYFETLPASRDNLEFAIRLEADRMVNSYVKREDLVSEMTVVRSEFERGENSPGNILRQRMMAVAFEWHNYGKSTIGNRSDIERVPIERLQAFYRKYYQPDNAMLIIAGQFEEKDALELAEEHFGAIPRPTREIEVTYTEEPAQDGERSVTLRRVGDVGMTGAVYHITAGSHEDFPALQILDEILTAEPAGRLYKSLVETKKAAAIYGQAYAWHDPGAYLTLAEVRDPDTLESVRDEMLATIEKVVEEGVTEEEVSRGKQRILSLRELAAANTTQIAIQLSEWSAEGDWRLYFLHRDRIEQVTPEQVQEVARKYFQRENRTVGMFIPTEEPQRVEIPAVTDLAELFEGYTGRAAMAAGEEFDPSPENIESRTLRTTVAGGIRAAFLPKKTRGESVHLRLTLRYGNAENLRPYRMATSFLPGLMARGAEGMTYQQIRDELSKNFATLNNSPGLGSATFQIRTKREHLPQVLEILGKVVRKPTLPESELEILKQETLSALEQQLTEPQGLAPVAVRRRIYSYPPEDVRYVMTLEERIEATKAVEVGQLQTLHEEFLSAQAGELVVLGDFDTGEIQKLIEDMLGGWQSEEPYARIEREAFPSVESELEKINTPGKANAFYFAEQSLAMRDDHPDYPALVLGDFILGSGSLASRLGDRVRQQEGLSYGIRSSFSANTFDERATSLIYAITNPQNVDKLVAVIAEEIELLFSEGVTQQELQEAQQGYLQSQKVARAKDASLLGILASSLYAERTLKFQQELEEKIAETTPEDVLAALKEHLDPKGYVIAVAGDMKQEETAAAGQ